MLLFILAACTAGSETFVEDDANSTTRIRNAPGTTDTTPSRGRWTGQNQHLRWNGSTMIPLRAFRASAARSASSSADRSSGFTSAGGRSADIIVVLGHRRDIPYPRAAAIQPDVRLTFPISPTADDAVDGGWWPRTRDPATELPALADAVAGRLGVVRQITVNADAWDSWPRQLRIIGGPSIRLEWCTGDAHTIRLTTGASHLVLLAIPADTPAILALACLNSRTSPSSVRTR